MEKLNIALVHLDVRHGEIGRNRRELVSLNRKAAESGAKIIVNTELGLTGYSFGSREEIAPMVETKSGPTIEALSDIAASHGCYIVLGYAEEERRTGIFYNAAAVVGPDGKLLLGYRKITAEVRWACAGSPSRPNTFDTPWGRVGVAICSDTYYGAIPRMAALRGADLLLVPANWPGGSLDPKELWRVRARENGFYLAACNRGGNDKTMSCEDAYSCVYGPEGEELLAERSCPSRVFTVGLPLEKGRLRSMVSERMRSRSPEHYSPIYLDMRYAADMTEYCRLPSPGKLRVVCQPADSSGMFADGGLPAPGGDVSRADLLVFPTGYACDAGAAVKQLVKTAGTLQCAVCAGIATDDGLRIACVDRNGAVTVRSCADPSPCRIDLDSARIALAGRGELYHPEVALALAKQGCDLVVVPSVKLDEHDRRVLGARSIEQVAVAASGSDRAFLCQPPEGHDRWPEAYTEGTGEPCAAALDISRLRRKRFYDRLDYELLLGKPPFPGLNGGEAGSS